MNKCKTNREILFEVIDHAMFLETHVICSSMQNTGQVCLMASYTSTSQSKELVLSLAMYLIS